MASCKILDEKITAIEKVHREFSKIMQLERCRTCSCFHADMMASILDTIQDINSSRENDSRLTAAGKDFSKWIEDASNTDLHH
jgi:hypothetical protein